MTGLRMHRSGYPHLILLVLAALIALVLLLLSVETLAVSAVGV
jgi:hypothetical protein